MGLSTADIKHFQEWDTRLVEAAKSIKVLSSLGWSAKVCDNFLTSFSHGNPRLPEVPYPKFDYSVERRALLHVIQGCDSSHPLGRYIVQTASSYILAARMLESVGSEEFCELSKILYGIPTDRLGTLSNLDLADDFIRLTGDFAQVGEESKQNNRISPEEAVEQLKKRAEQFFTHHKISVKIDPDLAARAAAGSERIRIRANTGFAPKDIDQLVEHELFVHSATMLNGQAQPILKSFGLGAPRTTGTQEGLATFAEMITATMDLSRLRRIALRIRAIQMALDGEDFIGVFRYFLTSGQTPKESFQSTARIFRGGQVKGKFVFTKDVVYLKGLFLVHTFLKKAMELRKINYPSYLFVGRIALGDILSLEELIRDGVISPPLYMPKWVVNREGLAVYLSYSLFTNRLSLADVSMQDFVHDASTYVIGAVG